MNRKRIVLLIVLLAVCGALFYFYAGHSTPAGQPALTSLTSENFSTLAAAFNATKDEVRVVLLLSPT
jgi:hypothetical protein